MFKRLAVLTLTLLLLASCAPEAVLPTKPTDNPPPVADGESSGATSTLSGHLTISADVDDEDIYTYTKAFTALHPGVTFTIRERGGSARKRLDDATAIATALMNGQGEDLICVAFLPYEQYARRGMFADLNEFLDQDPELKADFYPKLLDAMTVDGGLYALPRSISFQAYRVNSTYAEQVSGLSGDRLTLDYRQAIEMFEVVRAGDKPPLYVSNCFSLYELASSEEPRFYNYAAKYVEFEQDFIDMAEEIAPYTVPDLNSQPPAAQCLFSAYPRIHSVVSAAALLPNAAQRYLIDIGTDEKLLAVTGLDLYAINANSENKELAWEFLKYISSNEVLSATLQALIPTRKSVLRGAFVETGITYARLPAETVAATVDLLEELFERVEGYRIWEPFVFDATIAAYQDYNDGLITAEQLAARLQEKLTLYVNQ